jgi:hypothetical protein
MDLRLDEVRDDPEPAREKSLGLTCVVLGALDIPS